MNQEQLRGKRTLEAYRNFQRRKFLIHYITKRPLGMDQLTCKLLDTKVTDLVHKI